MWCMICKKELSECTCEDMQQRLDRLVASGRFVYRRCKKCKLHYAKCKCEEPEWEVLQE